MSSEHLPTEDEPAPREVLQALQKALHDNSSLKRASAEELAKQLSVGGYLKAKASPPLVADMLRIMKAGGLGLRAIARLLKMAPSSVHKALSISA